MGFDWIFNNIYHYELWAGGVDRYSPISTNTYWVYIEVMCHVHKRRTTYYELQTLFSYVWWCLCPSSEDNYVLRRHILVTTYIIRFLWLRSGWSYLWSSSLRLGDFGCVFFFKLSFAAEQFTKLDIQIIRFLWLRSGWSYLCSSWLRLADFGYVFCFSFPL